MLIDYARPCMMAEKALKEVHLAMLSKDYNKALLHTVETLIETVRMLDAIQHAKDGKDAVRQ